jgi:hypothetical protein
METIKKKKVSLEDLINELDNTIRSLERRVSTLERESVEDDVLRENEKMRNQRVNRFAGLSRHKMSRLAAQICAQDKQNERG